MVKWYLWHGNVFRTLQELTWLVDYGEAWGETHQDAVKLAQRLWEFHDYISNNRDWIPNYGEHYRYGERMASTIATASGWRPGSRSRWSIRWSASGW
jgi:hypothetical protein